MKQINLNERQRQKKVSKYILALVLLSIVAAIGTVAWIYFTMVSEIKQQRITNSNQIELQTDVAQYIQPDVQESVKEPFSTLAVYEDTVYYINENYNICRYNMRTKETMVKEHMRVEKFIIHDHKIYYLNRNGEQYDLFSMTPDFDQQEDIAYMLGEQDYSWDLIGEDIYYSKKGKGFCRLNLDSRTETVIFSGVAKDFQKYGETFFISSRANGEFRSYLYGVKGDYKAEKIMNADARSFHIVDNVLYFTNNDKLFSIAFEDGEIKQVVQLNSNHLELYGDKLFYMDHYGVITEYNVRFGDKQKLYNADSYEMFEILGDSGDTTVLKALSLNGERSMLVTAKEDPAERRDIMSFRGNPVVVYQDGMIFVYDGTLNMYDLNLQPIA
ncbi:DUF5050 domain-containing protein [Christensenella tenuis]|uniref:DUF5050 domain-containing protein n=1 Tax=Christensenella tenuis TaxID=2763033 RepID=A0ABR7EGR5_9FIRM|nr:DUF5050 domain-containing protein [Christensenella tenuis]MBC5648975.1 DUF5050 domain-containing protein [Christensenella tenuis]